MSGLRLWVLVLLCLLAVAPALAQRPATTPAQTTAPAAANDAQQRKQRASEHFERGVMLYGDGAHRAALIEFERAYETLPDFRLLYNIAHVRMLLEDYLAA